MSRRTSCSFRATIVAIGGLLAARPADAAPGKWSIDHDTAALTNLPTVTATLDAEKPLTNMIGRPAAATLVLRCRDGVLAAYVSWPEVIARFTDNMAGDPKALALFKLDDGAIGNALWDIASTGTAAGAFTSGPAGKLIARWRGAHRLVIRLSGETTQDAVFALDGIDDVVAQVTAACGATTGDVVTPAPAAFSAGASTILPGPASTALAAARRLLEGEGFRVTRYDEASGTLVTAPREMKVTPKQANCGGVLGIPYLADRRAHPTLAYRVDAADGRLAVKVAIGGVYKGGAGAPDTPLRCTSRGLIEQALLDQLAGGAHGTGTDLLGAR